MEPKPSFLASYRRPPNTAFIRASLTVDDCAPYIFVTNAKRADYYCHQTWSALPFAHGQCDGEFVVQHHINMNKVMQLDADSSIFLIMMDCHSSFLKWSLPYFSKRPLPEDPWVQENMIQLAPIMKNWNRGGGCSVYCPQE